MAHFAEVDQHNKVILEDLVLLELLPMLVGAAAGLVVQVGMDHPQLEV